MGTQHSLIFHFSSQNTLGFKKSAVMPSLASIFQQLRYYGDAVPSEGQCCCNHPPHGGLPFG